LNHGEEGRLDVARGGEVCIIGARGPGGNANPAKAVGAGLEHSVPKPYTAASILNVVARALADRG
jgi:hypothetical protein